MQYHSVDAFPYLQPPLVHYSQDSSLVLEDRDPITHGLAGYPGGLWFFIGVHPVNANFPLFEQWLSGFPYKVTIGCGARIAVIRDLSDALIFVECFGMTVRWRDVARDWDGFIVLCDTSNWGRTRAYYLRNLFPMSGVVWNVRHVHAESVSSRAGS